MRQEEMNDSGDEWTQEGPLDDGDWTVACSEQSVGVQIWDGMEVASMRVSLAHAQQLRDFARALDRAAAWLDRQVEP
jgi:hypothetical protein